MFEWHPAEPAISDDGLLCIGASPTCAVWRPTPTGGECQRMAVFEMWGLAWPGSL